MHHWHRSFQKLPTTTSAIQTSLFENCSKLREVNGEAVTSIHDWAFYKCSTLVALHFGAVTDIGHWAFCDCQNLRQGDIISPWTESLKTVGVSAFEGTGVQIVDLSACTQLSAELPDGLFQHCYSLQECTLNPKTSSLPSSLFEGCYSFKTLHWEPEGGLESAVIGARAFRKCSSFWQTDLFAAESIGDYAFEGTGFADIDLTPVRNLGKGVLKDCLITQCTFGSEFTEIPEEMFAGCEYLQTVQPINQLTNVGRAAFKGCSQFSNLEILKVASIGEEAFAGTAYTRLDFSQITERFYAGAFRDCQNLEWVSWPSSETYLPDYLFAGCSKLSTIEGLDRITDFGSGALMGCPISSIPFSPEAQYLSSSCFEGTLISSLDLTNTQILHIPDAGFKDCQYLSQVTLTRIFTIGAQAFQGCRNLRTITIPDAVDSIGIDCFRDCSSLETVIYQGTSPISNSIFQGCTSLHTVTVPSNYEGDHFGEWPLETSEDSGKEQGGEGDGDSPLPPGGIAGIVIAVLIIVGVAAFLAVFFLVIRKRRTELDDEDKDDETAENTSSIHI